VGAQGIERVKRAASFAAIVLTVLPFLLVKHLPLVDLPNHIARLIIREDLHAGGPLSAFYEWHWLIIPNLAIDLLSIPFEGWVDPETFVFVLTVLSVIGVYGGAIAIDRTLNGARWGVSILTGLIVFHGALRYGFVNYVIGLAFAVPLFAAWLRWRQRLNIATVLIFAAAGAFVMLMHMFAFGLYALCVVGYELSLLLQERPLKILPLRRQLPLIGVAMTLLVPASIVLMGPTSDAIGIILWSSPAFKVEALVSPIYFSQPLIEMIIFIIILMAVVILYATKNIEIDHKIIPTLAIISLVFIVMPRTLFGSTFADYRLLCGAGFFVIGGIRLSSRSRRFQYAAIACGSTLLLIRVGSVGVEWRAAQPILEEYRAVFSVIPQGARVLVQRPFPPSVALDRSTALEHIVTLPAARQKVFVGNTFALLAQPLRLRPNYLEYRHGSPESEPPLSMDKYDYILSINGHRRSAIERECIHEISSGSSFKLYKIKEGCLGYK